MPDQCTCGRVKDASAGESGIVDNTLLDTFPVQRVHADHPFGHILYHLGNRFVCTDAEQLADAVDTLIGIDADKLKLRNCVVWTE